MLAGVSVFVVIKDRDPKTYMEERVYLAWVPKGASTMSWEPRWQAARA